MEDSEKPSGEQIEVKKPDNVEMQDTENGHNEDQEVQIIETEVEPVSAPAVPTKTVYSWYYYEREDQFDNLFDCLNLKGQRERKLQESLKKIKDRLKLKKAKKVAVTKLPVIPAVSENQKKKKMIFNLNFPELNSESTQFQSFSAKL